MTDDRLSTVLFTWRDWCHRPDIKIGWKPNAAPFISGGVVSAENRDGMTHCEEYERLDYDEAEITDTVIHDLPPILRDSVFNALLGTRRPLGRPLEQVYVEARAALKVGLRRRGVE